ncbi:heme ABC exporter ATP-binding protein CcmA [candidate division KSB1 bacterium]|nr:heme ABC exporter ATP-binding protein CcmA [candidate division KSB1 bacterium]
MIEGKGITKSFGHLHALNDVSFQIKRGEFVALMGANGAGKTTLIRILAGLARASHGSVSVAGYAVDKAADNVRRSIGVVSHHTLLYGDLSAEENLRFYGRMYGVKALAQRIDELLNWVELKHRRFDLVRTFSRGMQQRLALARAILHQPRILLLDEPFTGLDVHARELLTRFIDQFIRQQVTVLLTIHEIDFALMKAQRLLLLQKGRLIVDSQPNKLNRSHVLELLQEH